MPTATKIKLTRTVDARGKVRWRKRAKINNVERHFSYKQQDGETEAQSKKNAWFKFQEWKAALIAEADSSKQEAAEAATLKTVERDVSRVERERIREIVNLQNALIAINEAIADGETEASFLEKRQAMKENPKSGRQKIAYDNKRIILGLAGIKQKLNELQETDSDDSTKTVFQMIDMYLNRRKIDLDNKQIVIDRYDTIRSYLGVVKKHSTDTTLINAEWLNSFYIELMNAKYVRNGIEKEYSSKYRKEVFATCKEFIRWAWENELIDDLPRNINSFRIKVELKEPETITVKDMREYYFWASGKPRLYFLLALNCGFYSSDISELTKKEIDLDNGTITHKRVKTKNEKNVPTVTYQLFPETLELLKHFINTDKKTELALTDTKGEKLIKKRLKNGKQTKSDTIRNAFMRVFNTDDYAKKIEEGEFSRFNMMNLRKTSSSLIYEKFPEKASLFLAHAPNSVAERHYLKVSKDALTEPLFHLYQELKLNEWELLDRSKMQTKV